MGYLLAGLLGLVVAVLSIRDYRAEMKMKRQQAKREYYKYITGHFFNTITRLKMGMALRDRLDIKLMIVKYMPDWDK